MPLIPARYPHRLLYASTGLHRHDRDTSRERGHKFNGTQGQLQRNRKPQRATEQFNIRRRPYSGPSLARGILLMYRRNKTNGTWVLKVSDGHGAYWTKAFALADDFEDADGKNVLTFHQAQEQAKKLAAAVMATPTPADHGRWRAESLQDRSDGARGQSLQRRMAARTPHQRAAVEAGGVARGHRVEEMA